MQTKNLTPFLFGAKVTSRAARELEMTMIVRATYRLEPGKPLTCVEGLLDQGAMSGDRFAEDDDERAGECLYPSDFADYKPRADILVRGTCYPPGGRAVRESTVRVAVGAWSKALRVVGRRVWTESLLGAPISEPQPFASMPLGWENAFGGPAHPDNPIGKGLGTPELPNVELVHAPLTSPRDRPPPAGFGPLNPAWRERAEKVGKEYGKAYQERRAPFYAEDFDWSHFNAAPADQQIPYLRGDEEIAFENMHPSAPRMSARLPALRVRAFARRDDGEVHEAKMVLDTVFADVGSTLVYLTWRGLVPVREDDLKDVRTVLIASEPLADEPLPAAHYLGVLEKFEADPAEFDARIPEDAKKTMAALEAIAAEDRAQPGRPALDRTLSILEGKLELFPEAHRPMIQRAAEKLKQAAATSGAAIGPANETGSPGEAMARWMARAKALQKEAQDKGLHVRGMEELERLMADPRMAVAGVTPPDPSRPREEPGPGRDLSGRDLSGQDLCGRDLSAAILERANLRGAKLRGAVLRGANLRAAILRGADLSGADLSGADLTRANLTEARAEGAKLDGATLDQAILTRARLAGASLSGAKATMALLTGADLTGATAQRAHLFKVFADGAILERADWSAAELLVCVLMRTRGAGANLSGATLTKTSFAESDFSGASFVEARGEGAAWLKARLSAADFRHADLPGAHFMEAAAAGARFFGANLPDAGFYRAELDQAEVVRANLIRANLSKASLKGTRLSGSNLYDAKLLDAVLERCDLTDANLKRATLPRA